MRDDEIATKRLSDWQPEPDLKLQKAFGKFVEEAGELLEAGNELLIESNVEYVVSLEDEIADCLALIYIIDYATDGSLGIIQRQAYCAPPLIEERITYSNMLPLIFKSLGASLKIVGRCQIQGLDGKDPETTRPNRSALSSALAVLKITLEYAVHNLGLYGERIERRRLAKIDSKLPWVMGALGEGKVT